MPKLLRFATTGIDKTIHLAPLRPSTPRASGGTARRPATTAATSTSVGAPPELSPAAAASKAVGDIDRA